MYTQYSCAIIKDVLFVCIVTIHKLPFGLIIYQFNEVYNTHEKCWNKHNVVDQVNMYSYVHEDV